MSNIKILGDSNKKSRFNKDLADVVNKDVESRLRKEAVENKNSLGNIAINDLSNVEWIFSEIFGGRTCREWLTYWFGEPKIDNTRIMATCADYYILGKSGSDKDIANLRKYLGNGGTITNDLIAYSPLFLNAIISNYRGGKVPSFDRNIVIPNYSGGKTLNNILNTTQGLEYIQSLFNTLDCPDEIRHTLSRLFGVSSKNIEVATLHSNSRLQGDVDIDNPKVTKNVIRAVVLSVAAVGYGIIGSNYELNTIINHSCGFKYLSPEVKK